MDGRGHRIGRRGPSHVSPAGHLAHKAGLVRAGLPRARERRAVGHLRRQRRCVARASRLAARFTHVRKATSTIRVPVHLGRCGSREIAIIAAGCDDSTRRRSADAKARTGDTNGASRGPKDRAAEQCCIRFRCDGAGSLEGRCERASALSQVQVALKWLGTGWV